MSDSSIPYHTNDDQVAPGQGGLSAAEGGASASGGLPGGGSPEAPRLVGDTKPTTQNTTLGTADASASVVTNEAGNLASCGTIGGSRIAAAQQSAGHQSDVERLTKLLVSIGEGYTPSPDDHSYASQHSDTVTTLLN